MNAGVCTSPCGVLRIPRRAEPSVLSIENENTSAAFIV
jgi:hypothetical protein